MVEILFVQVCAAAFANAGDSTGARTADPRGDGVVIPRHAAER